jgi:type I restriction enzyme S subunit
MNINNFKVNKSGWKRITIGELAEEISVRVENPEISSFDKFVGLEHFNSGEIKLRNYSSTKGLVSAAKAFKSGDVLFARRNAYLRRASQVDFEGVCSGDAFVLREKCDQLSPGYLAYIVNSDSLWSFANSNAAGTMSKRVKWKDLCNFEVLIPPKEKQQSILTLLKSCNNVVLNVQNLISKSEMVRDTSREKLYTEGIDFDSKKPLKKSKCGLIREDFDVVKFFDCVDISNGQVDPKLDEYSGLYQIGSERIEPNTGAITEFRTAKELKIISGNFLFTEKDIIYSKIRPYFKKVANPNFTGLCSADIYPLRPKDNLISKEYLFYYLLTEKFTRRLLRFQNRTGMPKVNRDELGSMYIPIPPAGEGKLIVNLLKEIDQVYFTAVTKYKKSKEMLNSMINEVF